MKKLFKLLSLLKLLRELRYSLRGGHRHHRHYGPPRHGYGPGGDHWHPRARDYYPLYGRRSKKPKLKHLVYDVLSRRRY